EAKQRSEEALGHAPEKMQSVCAQLVRVVENEAAALVGQAGEKRRQQVEHKIDALEQEVATRHEFTFEAGEDRFLHETLARLVADLGAFSAEKGELAAVRHRLEEAEHAVEASIERHRAEWDAAIQAIAKSDDLVASKLYGHLVLRPQIGLVP